MEISDTFEGTQIIIKAQGGARFFAASFLGVWLCGWLVGEVVALSMLFLIAWQLLTGVPFVHKPQLPHGGALYAIGGFLLVWGSFWTLGGFAALREFARLLWGREVIILRPDSLRIRTLAFPFGKTKDIPISELRGFSYQSRRKRGLFLELAQGRADLSLLSNDAERRELETLVRKRYPSVFGGYSHTEGKASVAGIGDANPHSIEGRLPADWVLESLPEGNKGLMRDPEIRRKQIRILWICAFAFDGACAYLAYLAVHKLALAPLAIIFALAGGGCTLGAIRMGFGRPEWLIGKGVLTLQRRSASGVKTEFQGVRIELDINEGEDTNWTSLYVLDASAREQPPYERGHQKLIANKSTDGHELRLFGHYLAQHTGLPFIDRSNPELRGSQLRALKERLEQGGAFSRWVAEKIKTPKE